jgi:hypothetical protein
VKLVAQTHSDILHFLLIPLLIKLLGPNYKAVASVAEISALHFIGVTHSTPETCSHSFVQCLLAFVGAFTFLSL